MEYTESMPTVVHPHIAIDPNICGGSPRIDKTRITVRTIVIYVLLHGQTPTTLALKSLLQKGLLETCSYQDNDGDYYTGYMLTDRGWTWVLENKDKFVLQRPPKERSVSMTLRHRVA